MHGGDGNDTLVASAGGDTLAGGGGHNVFTFSQEPWSPITITDFDLGVDRLDVTPLLKAVGYTGADPVADGYFKLVTQGIDTLVLFDRDGPGDAQPWPNYIAKVLETYNNQLSWKMLTQGPDALPNHYFFATTAVSHPEGDSGTTDFAFEVTRTGDLTHTSGVEWFTQGIEADSRSDFVSDDRFVTFNPGESTKSFTVHVNGDTEVEGDERFRIYLTDESSPTVMAPDVAIGTILNDDAPPTPAGEVLTAARAGDTLTGGAGADTLVASNGPDQLTGGEGADRFVFDSKAWAPAHITDFQSGVDRVDLHGLLQAIGYTGADPFADGHLQLLDGNKLIVDADGVGGQWGDFVLDFDGVKVTPGDFLF